MAQQRYAKCSMSRSCRPPDMNRTKLLKKKEKNKLLVPDFVSCLVYFSRTLPKKRNGKRALLGDLDVALGIDLLPLP